MRVHTDNGGPEAEPVLSLSKGSARLAAPFDFAQGER